MVTICTTCFKILTTECIYVFDTMLRAGLINCVAVPRSVCHHGLPFVSVHRSVRLRRSGRAVWGISCLLPLEHWSPEFESHSMCLYSVSVGSGLATGSSPVQGVTPTVYRITKLKKKRPRPKKRAVEPLMNEWTDDSIVTDLINALPGNSSETRFNTQQ
jgi:hypothetical protein